MASHSRPVAIRRITVSRTALTLAVASAASVSFLGETGSAQPRLTPTEVKAEVDALYREAEQATQSYEGAKSQADAARSALTGIQDELARKTARLNTTRDTIGSLAAAQYRSGGLGPSVQLALSSSPDTYLERAGLLNQLGYRQTTALSQLAAQQRDMARTRTEAAGRLAALRSAQQRLAERKKAVESKLAAAQSLLATLTARERAAVTADDSPPAAPAAASRSRTRAPLGPLPGTSAPGTPAPSARAAQAVAFAYRALGLPYVWGATGPNAFDCSGLTQAAWKSAGVALPRTTYTQINAGTRVPESALLPGDLVFFYSGISHVGLYIGNGRMIHAPHPGAAVRIAPVSEMPFAGATRPA